MEWTPIGTESQPYTGTFDGNGKTITELKITGSNDYAGLFGRIGSGGTVKDVTLTKASVTGGNIVGGVVGSLQNGCSLMACYSTGNVTATLTTGYAGGVVGQNSQGTVTGCYHATGTVKGTAGYVGGIVGRNTLGTFTACYWSGSPGNDNGGTTEEVTDGNWSEAMTAMNAALKSAGSALQYNLGVEGLPALE